MNIGNYKYQKKNGNDAVIEILEEFKKQDDKIYHPIHILYFEFTQNSKHSHSFFCIFLFSLFRYPLPQVSVQ